MTGMYLNPVILPSSNTSKRGPLTRPHTLTQKHFTSFVFLFQLFKSNLHPEHNQYHVLVTRAPGQPPGEPRPQPAVAKGQAASLRVRVGGVVGRGVEPAPNALEPPRAPAEEQPDDAAQPEPAGHAAATDDAPADAATTAADAATAAGGCREERYAAVAARPEPGY